MTVLTLNLLYAGALNPAGAWSARLPLVLDVLRSGADLIALQEATWPQLHDLQHALPEFTVVVGPPSGETRLPRALQHAPRLLRRATAHSAREEHCAILYRTEHFTWQEGSAFWLSHTPTTPGTVLSGTWLPRVVNWVRLRENASGNPVTLYNAHLDFLPWAPLRSARILRTMLDDHWDGSLQVLMGDFNAPPRSAAYTHLGKELTHTPHPPLQDAWELAAERDGPEGTYHGGTGRIRWMGRLDRILLRPIVPVLRVSTLTHRSETAYPSDHYPVRAELGWEALGPDG